MEQKQRISFVLLLFVGLTGIAIQACAEEDHHPIHIDTFTPFAYIFMEFNGEYHAFTEKYTLFVKETQRQGIAPHLQGQPFAIYFDNQQRRWGIGRELKSVIPIHSPLFRAEYSFRTIVHTVRKDFTQPEINKTYHLLIIHLDQKGFQIAGPSIRRVYAGNEANDPATASGIETIIPIKDKQAITLLKDNISILIVVITIAAYLFFAFYLIFKRRGKQPANRLFAIFLLANAMDLCDWLQNHHLLLFIAWPHAMIFGRSFLFLAGPALFLLARSLVQREFHWRPGHGLHLLPWLADTAFSSMRFYFHSPDVKRELLLTSGIFSQWEIALRLSALDLQLLAYLAATWLTLRRYRRELRNSVSFAGSFDLP
jgi:hypothetical protein